MSAPRTHEEAEAVAREVIRQRSAFGRAVDTPRHEVRGIAGPSNYDDSHPSSTHHPEQGSGQS